MGSSRSCSPVVLISTIVLFILVIIVIKSFSYLDFYEYGFLQRRTTGRANVDHVYESGRHFVGPDYNFKEFKASVHQVQLMNTSVFTTDHLRVHLNITFQYFLIKEDLSLLHTAYDTHYQPIIIANAKEAIVVTCSRFDSDEFIYNRNKIRNEIYLGVKRRLGGSCCIPNCKMNCPKCQMHEQCIPDCKPREKHCTTEDKGLFIEVRYLQLHDINIPKRVIERRLLSLVRDLDKEKEEFINQQVLIKKQTDILVNQYRNNATQTIAYVETQAKLIREKAKAEARKNIQSARIDSLASMCSILGFTQAKHINHLEYLQTLYDPKNNISYVIDFSHIVYNNLN